MKMSQYIPFYRRNLQLALPVVLSQIGQVTVHLVDNMMVGHVGTTELAASSFANNIFMIGMYFGMGITYGITPLVGKSFGNGKLKDVSEWLKNGLTSHLLSGIVLTIVMFSIYFILPHLGQTSNVTELAKNYYLLLCASYLPFMLFFSFKQFFEGIGNTTMAMIITLISNLVNIFLNYIFIFGKFGMPALGLFGAGLGTLISRLLMPVLFAFLIFRKPNYKRYFLYAHRQIFSIKKSLRLMKIGIPIAFQLVVEVLAFGAGAVMMGWLGETPLAAHQVALGLASVTYMISLGISQANTIRVSHQLGKRNFEDLKKAAYASTHLVLLFMSIMALVFVLANKLLPLLFTTDESVIIIAANLLIIAAIFQIFDGLQVVMLSTLRGMADVKIPMYIAIVAYLMVGIPTSYIFSFVLNIGPQGIWYGYLVGLGIAGVLFYARFKRKYNTILS